MATRRTYVVGVNNTLMDFIMSVFFSAPARRVKTRGYRRENIPPKLKRNSRRPVLYYDITVRFVVSRLRRRELAAVDAVHERGNSMI